MENSASLPIGIFDSGVGGLTVLSALEQELPHESFLYLGDTARVPYGNKSKETIVRYSLENTVFLLEKKIKLLVVACNTVSAFALSYLEDILKIPMLGVIEPGVACAVKNFKGQSLTIIGTRGTILSGAYQTLLSEKLPGVKIHSIPCPLFVPLVEEGHLSGSFTEKIVAYYLEKTKEEAGTLLLGCTHYPLLIPLLKDYLGPQIALVDSATSCALKVKEALESKGLQNPSSNKGTMTFYVSDAPERFKEVGSRFISFPIDSVFQMGEHFNTREGAFL